MPFCLPGTMHSVFYVVLFFLHPVVTAALINCRDIYQPSLLRKHLFQSQLCSLRYNIFRRAVDDGQSEGEWYSDFDGYIGENFDNDASKDVAGPSDFPNLATVQDLTGCQTRQFSLGKDLVLTSFVGTMGFEEVTDWEYYYPNEDDPTDRSMVQPFTFDTSMPKRTRTKSGSVVRLFRGDFVGLLGGMLSAQGRDPRVLIKEFTGKLALELARAELNSISELQSNLLLSSGQKETSDWVQIASTRSVNPRQDHANVAKLLNFLSTAPFLGILGEVYLAELEGTFDSNEFYRALSVPPPKSDAIWFVYEYAGLSSLQAYSSQPPQFRRANLPRKRGFFGNLIEPPALPRWRDRATYVKAIMKQSIQALAKVHETGLVHRSIGRSSLLLSSTTMDKNEAASMYATQTSQLVMKLADFGFSGKYQDSWQNDEFCTRARSFGLDVKRGPSSANSIATANFAIAEDMHALGFVFLGLLLTVLAELEEKTVATDGSSVENKKSFATMPATDEDTLQRLLGDIFKKDVKQFREYVEAEEVWSKLVDWLDENNGAGWIVLEALMLAREKAAQNKNSPQMFTIRGLLSNAFFTKS